MENDKANKKHTPLIVQIIAAAVIIVVVGGVGLVLASPGLRARYYASQIGEGGNNGAAANKIVEYGADIALPLALEMMQSDDYLRRRYAMFIIGNLPSTARPAIDAHIDEIMAAAVKDPRTRNRTHFCQILGNLYFRQRQYCGLMVPFLKDEEEEVRKTAIAEMQRIGDKDVPGQSADYWLDWWEKEKARLLAKGEKVKTVEMPTVENSVAE